MPISIKTVARKRAASEAEVQDDGPTGHYGTIAAIAEADAVRIRKFADQCRAILHGAPFGPRGIETIDEALDPRFVAIRGAISRALELIDDLRVGRPGEHADRMLAGEGLTRAEIARARGVTPAAIAKARARRRKAGR